MENTIENATAFLDELSDAFPKMRFSQAMVEYAASVRPEVVVPSEDTLNDFAKYLLNHSYVRGAYKPHTLVNLYNKFNGDTELNQPAQTGDKSDEG